jgi:glutamine---fructose-6-phosphate transaminase (isomerizing)
MREAIQELGINTATEILSQPACWQECFKALDEKEQITKAAAEFDRAAEWLFIGCGTSYYIAQVAAASWTYLTGQRAKAVPASEVLLYPDQVLAGSDSYQPVLVSRSGHTSEVVKAAEYLELKRNIRTLSISCATHQPLEQVSSSTIYVLPADEKSMVMTRSFTSMILSLQALAAEVGGKPEFTEALRGIPQQVQPILASLPSRIQAFAQSRTFADFVFLAQGPYFGLASEGQLKVKEMSCSYAQVFHTLEFRHGPKSIVGPETLVTFLLSESSFDAEREVLEEVKGLGGTTLVVTNRADAITQRYADLLVELRLDAPEYARLASHILPCQFLGLYTGTKKGMNPDNPRNLSRAVILGNNGK